jgi:hypothetical protein
MSAAPPLMPSAQMENFHKNGHRPCFMREATCQYFPKAFASAQVLFLASVLQADASFEAQARSCCARQSSSQQRSLRRSILDEYPCLAMLQVLGGSNSNKSCSQPQRFHARSYEEAASSFACLAECNSVLPKAEVVLFAACHAIQASSSKACASRMDCCSKTVFSRANVARGVVCSLA